MLCVILMDREVPSIRSPRLWLLGRVGGMEGERTGTSGVVDDVRSGWLMGRVIVLPSES